jgi:hypothetical protein
MILVVIMPGVMWRGRRIDSHAAHRILDRRAGVCAVGAGLRVSSGCVVVVLNSHFSSNAPPDRV